MKVVNKTRYDTGVLKKILYRVAQEELDPEDRRTAVVTIEYRRLGVGHAGRAYLFKPPRVKMLVPRKQIDPIAFAAIAGHEFAHTRGMTHHAMGRSPRYDWVPGWVDHYLAMFPSAPTAILPRPEPVKAKPTVDAKLAHAEKKVREASTRMKRATTIYQKWVRTVNRIRKVDSDLKLAAGKEPRQ